MKKYDIKNLVIIKILILIPFILFALYKNGYLIWQKGLITSLMILKPVIFVFLSIIIKVVIDLIIYKKLKIDYNLLGLILVGMIIPYNTNVFIYSGIIILGYLLTLKRIKFLTFNKFAFLYLIIIGINYLLNNLDFKTPLETNYLFNYNFWDLLIGKQIGGVSSTCIILSLISLVILSFNYYYKKNIPIIINIIYLVGVIIYYIITNNSTFIINSDLLFGSIFIATLPEYSPYNVKDQYIYAISIGVITFFIAIFINSILAIYLAIFIVSLIFDNLKLV